MSHIDRREMPRFRRILSVLIPAIVCAGVPAGDSALAGDVGPAGECPEPLTIWNGVEGDGSLTVSTGDFGLRADLFDPTGPLEERSVTFMALPFVFTGPSGCGAGTHRVALSCALPPAYAGGDLATEIIVDNHEIDFQTSASVFDVLGADLHLRFELTQRVDIAPPGPNGEASARLEQTYRITNQAGLPSEFTLLRHTDQDMLWGGGGNYLDEVVGVDFSELGRPQVFSDDLESHIASLVLRTREDMTQHPATLDFVYYVGKQFLTPPGNPDFPCAVCPAYGYGTGFQIWDNYGVPNCWKNYVPDVGYNVPGVSPTVSGDAFIGLQLTVSLQPGASYEVTFVTLYGFRHSSVGPFIMHSSGPDAPTTPCTGYVDPRLEVNPLPPNDPAGVQEAFVKFSTDVFKADGVSDVDASNFILSESCGGNIPPQVDEVEYVNGDQSYVRVHWDRPITLEVWTTLRAHVYNAGGVPIENVGDLGEGVQEPDRLDFAALPGDIDQSGGVGILDLLRFRQFVTGHCVVCPNCGGDAMYFDIDHNFTAGEVLDFLRFRQILLGTPPATQVWLLEQLDCEQP